jgi:hypothetical protein
MIIYLSLVNSKWSTPCTAFTALKTEKKSSNGGVLSNAARKAKDIADFAKSVPIPGVQEAATLFSSFAGATADVLSWFGFSKPLIYDHVSSWIRPLNNWTRVDGNVQSELLSLRSNNSVGIDVANYPLGDPQDMVVASLMERKGLISQFDIETVMAAGSFVGDIPVNPVVSRFLTDPSIANGYELTPLGFCAYPYEKWRGEMTFTIEWVCSVFHRATLMILYNPRSTTLVVPYIEYAPILQHWTIALNGHGETDITIPWKMVEHFLDVGVPRVSPNVPNRNGTLTMFLLNPVTTNGGTSPIHLNIYAKSSNMAFGIPRNLSMLPRCLRR